MNDTRLTKHTYPTSTIFSRIVCQRFYHYAMSFF